MCLESVVSASVPSRVSVLRSPLELSIMPFAEGSFSHLHPLPAARPGCPVPPVVEGCTAKITSFSKCIFRVYLIQGCNQKISLYLVWKSIICSTKSLLNYPYIYFLKGEIHVLNLNRISVIRIDSLLILCISKLICRDQNKIYNFHLLTSSRLSAVRDKNNNECFILCNPGLQKE